MTKGYLVASIDYEDFYPLFAYLDRNKADVKEKELQDALNKLREKLREERARTGQYYPNNWEGYIPSSSEGYEIYEIEIDVESN